MWYLYASGSWIETSPPTRGELFGDGVFETIHIREGRPLFLADHLRRLHGAAHALSLELPLSVDALAAMVIQQATFWRAARLKLVLYRAGDGTYMPLTREAHLRLGISSLMQEGFPLAAPRRLVVFPPGFTVATPWSGFKLLSAVGYVQAAAYARAQGCDDAIVLSAEGYLAETSRANLFFWDGRILHTPALRTGCVRGILRNRVIEAAKSLGIPLQEGLYPPHILREAREVFTANVIQGIVPVLGIRESGISYRTGPDTCAEALAKALAEKVG